MTAEEFLRDLALRVAVVEVPVYGEDTAAPQLDESGAPETELFLGLILAPGDAERFLDLTGVRVE